MPDFVMPTNGHIVMPTNDGVLFQLCELQRWRALTDAFYDVVWRLGKNMKQLFSTEIKLIYKVVIQYGDQVNKISSYVVRRLS